MVYSGFRDSQRDIPDPPPAQLAPTSTMKKTWMPDLSGGVFEDMEQAINKFLQLCQQLEKQEKKGFKELATLLSHLLKPAQGSARSMSVA